MAFEVPVHLQDLLFPMVWAKTDPIAVQMLIDCSDSYIHPVFARGRWADVSKTDYLRMSPSLVLATNIMTSRHSLHFWHALLYGPQTPVQDTDGKDRLRFDRVAADSTQPLPPDQAEAVRSTLLEMARVVTFRITDLDNANQAGVTVAEGRNLLCKDGPGVYSSITINSRLVDELDLRTVSLAPLLRRWFALAMTLCHEMAHAVSAARHGAVVEMFFEDDGFIELGFAFEKYQVGGYKVRRDWGMPQEALVIYKQPDPILRAAYLLTEQGFSVSVEVPQERQFIRYLPDEWIEQLFLRSYWDAMA